MAWIAVVLLSIRSFVELCQLSSSSSNFTTTTTTTSEEISFEIPERISFQQQQQQQQQQQPPQDNVLQEGLSLVTSFWAEALDTNAADGDPYQQSNNNNKNNKNNKDNNMNLHRREIEAAILANLQNPYLRQVVVILDSVNETTTMNCQGFIDYMTHLSTTMYTTNSSLSLVDHDNSGNSTVSSKLACIERSGIGQPTYFEMFHYATYHPYITSDKVIISNADQVFDETIYYAQQMSNTILFVLGSHGYHIKRTPWNVRKQYRTVIKEKEDPRGTMDRCKDGQMRGEWLRGYGDSWDTYIFHRSLLQGSLPYHVDPKDHGPSNENETFRRFNQNTYVQGKSCHCHEFYALQQVTQDHTV